MRITKITVDNFRSIKYADFCPSEFSVFVGQNNHGKTNLFEAIEWFYNGAGDLSQIRFLRDNSLDVSVELEFSGVQAGIETVKSEKNQEAFRRFANGRDVIRVIRRGSDGAKRSLWDEEKQEWSSKNFAGFDKAFNDCLPRLEYVATTTRLSDISKYGKKTPIGLMLSGVLTAVLERSPKYQEFRAKFDEVFATTDSDVRVTLDDLSGKVKGHLEQQFPDCTKVAFHVSEPAAEELLKSFETTINDGIETTAEEKGDGMQRALMLAIIKTHSDFRRESEELGKRFVFLIDEAELHLHPTAQRQLKTALLHLAEAGDQILINTHSSVLLADDHTKQSIFRVEKVDSVTNIKLIAADEKPYIVYELLGGSPADLLFPNNFMIVEGQSESNFLKQLLARFYSDKPKLQFVFAEGDINKQKRSMDGINTVLVPLYGTAIYRNRLVLLCDKPTPQAEKDFRGFCEAYKSLVKNKQVHVLPVESLEQYYPEPWRKTLDQGRAMKAREKTTLAEQAGQAISRQQFEADMPVLFEALKRAWEGAY
jgi:putative ATP-dependent endonuclease of OLD family